VDPKIAFRAVHATRGKHIRAEPIAALYEKGEILHAKPFETLEQQLLLYMPVMGKSFDRADALVWAMTDLCLNGRHGLPRVWAV
jgi:phage terminase large subunit-like protein